MSSPPHKPSLCPSPSSALSSLPRRRLLCPLPSSALSFAVVCSVLASPTDDCRLHLIPGLSFVYNTYNLYLEWLTGYRL
ncbi:hypothetical protein Scep_012931 [Stephania cephalantha]|uniref:Uncharacterized protein n=1 Tax=Stephania cephalantha TaxID=152367 RepID=A0AAP0P757_9MAGN